MPAPNQDIAPIAVTMGEPGGVGPEIVAALWRERTTDTHPFLLIGHADVFRAYAPDIPFAIIEAASDAPACFHEAMPVLEICDGLIVQPGVIVPENGSHVIEAIKRGVALALEGSVSALVTAPIHKAALSQAGLAHPGHTDFLAELCDRKPCDAVMMLANSLLRAIPVTVHQSLQDAIGSLTGEQIIHTAMTVHHDLIQHFGIKAPRLAISGLNPHAGEDGLMGMEDGLIIKPAIDKLVDLGINAKGPLPADTMFHSDARARYDAAICMYHDQALIPVKTLDFHGGVNVTLGLPIIRTSPDHGTALEIAGTGKANPGSFRAAMKMAFEMSEGKQNAGR